MLRKKKIVLINSTINFHELLSIKPDWCLKGPIGNNENIPGGCIFLLDRFIT